MRETRKVVGVLVIAVSHTLKVIPSDLHDAGVVPVTCQHLRAEGKKRRRWQTIVFQYDSLFFLLEEPRDSIRDASSQTHVRAPEQGVNFALPVHGCGYLPRSIAFFSVTRP